VNAEAIVLGIIEASGGALEGRTRLQKMAYFVSRKLSIPAGFEPHYYGPYSRLISAETDGAVSRSILHEERKDLGASRSAGDFKRVLYKYSLSPRGRTYLKALKSLDHNGFGQLAEIVTRIRGTGADYRQLSCAAKIDYLLRRAGGKTTRSRAKTEARQLGWRLSDADIEAAIFILEKLEIVKPR